jgi:hypothetical protein
MVSPSASTENMNPSADHGAWYSLSQYPNVQAEKLPSHLEKIQNLIGVRFFLSSVCSYFTALYPE